MDRAREFTDPSPLSLQCIGDTLIATAQRELGDTTILQFRMHLLDRLERSPTRALIVDVSAVAAIDRHELGLLEDTLAMARIMGTRPILLGLSPGIAAALVEMDGGHDELARHLEIAASLDDALHRLAEKQPWRRS